MGVEKALELSVLRSAFFAEPGHANSRAADIVYRSDAGIHEQPVCRVDQIRSEVIKDTLQCFIEFEFFPGGRMGGVNLGVDFAKQRNFPAKHTNVEELGFESVIEVGGVVCHFIDAIDELSLERRTQIKKIFGKLRKFRGGIIARMLDDTFANFKCKIQTGKIKIALLELFDDAEGVQIVIEVTAAHAHQYIELPLAGMAERRMANVVDQRERFGEIGIQAESRGHGASNLRDLQRVRQAVAEMVGIAGGKDLCLSFETAESAGMDDAVAVTRVGAAVGMRRLRITPATRLLRAHRPRSGSGGWIDG